MSAQVAANLIFALIVLSIFAVYAQSQEPSEISFPPISLYHKTEEFKIQDTSQPYQLKNWLIIQESEVVRVNGEVLKRGIDYVMDYTAGNILIKKAVSPDAMVKIEYHTVPLSIKRNYKRQLFPPEKPQRLERPIERRDQEVPPTVPESWQSVPTSLQHSITKTFSVSLGSNRSLTPDQSLRVNINGKISENIDVTAMLSDQNMPLQPDGTTEELSEIEQKLIRIVSPHLSATLGDYEGFLSDSEYVFFPKPLEGVLVQGNFNWGSFNLIPSAIPRGRSSSKTMQGIEGQSQYRVDADGQYIVMKAGSEIVWLNGERMRRGENNDYIIAEYGDPIIEFTNKHLITSNDVIRVDFEYIAEDMAYRRELHGFGGKLNFLEGNASIGVTGVLEADDNHPDRAYIILTDEDIEKLKRNELEDGEETLIAPQKHSVLGCDGRFDIGNRTHVLSELAFSSLDKNTFSSLDKVDTSRAWKIQANTSTEKLRLNLDMRGMDANFVPVGATATSRSRYRYEQQYQQEGGDIFLAQDYSKTPSENSADLSLQYEPVSGVRLDAGLGRTAESYPDEPSLDTVRKNWNRGLDVNIPKLPRLRTKYYANTNVTNGRENFKWTRETFDVTHRIGTFNFNLDAEYLTSIDLNPSDNPPPLTGGDFNRNRKRHSRGLKIDTAGFKWATLSGEYSFEESFKKESEFSIDGNTLTYSDWQKDTTARTMSAGIFSKPVEWSDFSSNFSRRIFKELSDGSETETNLADVRFSLTPFRSAFSVDVNYEIDRKLASEKVEIFTNTLYGRPILPGQGTYVKIDEYHYQEDSEKGDYIRIVKTVGDKPVSAVKARFRLNIRPRQFFAKSRRKISIPNKLAHPSLLSFARNSDLVQTKAGETNSQATATNKPNTQSETRLGKIALRGVAGFAGFFAQSLTGGITLDVTEEQEKAQPGELYLLRNLQGENTISGRKSGKYQLEFEPTRLFTINVGYNLIRRLNKRINSRERQYHTNSWTLEAKSAPTTKVSLGVEWEKRRTLEKIIDMMGTSGAELAQKANPRTTRIISDIIRNEKTSSLNFRYALTKLIDVGLQGEYKTEDDVDMTETETDTHTRSVSLESFLSYSLIGKGRLNFSYKIAHGKSKGNLPFARYNFHDGTSHEARLRADYKLRKVSDLILRLNYRLLATERDKPEHRAEVEVVAEL